MSKKRYVYIVVSSVCYEGGTILGIFTSKARATECYDDVYADTLSGDWHLLKKVELNDPNLFLRVETEETGVVV